MFFMDKESPLITNETIEKWLNNDVNILPVFVFLKPISQQDKTEISKRLIPRSIIFDLGQCRSPKSDYPNTIPEPEFFESFCQKLGINKSHKLVLYDNNGIYASPRLWLLFELMGFKNVSVLDGGLHAWLNSGRPTSPFHQKNLFGNFKAIYNPSILKLYQDIVDINHTEILIIDARSPDRFKGMSPEPRPNLRSGHIPGSKNIPWQEVISNGRFKSKAELREIFLAENPKNKDIIFSCGSGITASILYFAYYLAFNKHPFLYDGSWTEWATKQGLFT